MGLQIAQTVFFLGDVVSFKLCDAEQYHSAFSGIIEFRRLCMESGKNNKKSWRTIMKNRIMAAKVNDNDNNNTAERLCWVVRLGM